jgi:oligopeptidase A
MNPLLARDIPIPFDQIRSEHVEPGLREALTSAQEELERLLAPRGARSYHDTIVAYDDLTERLARPFGTVRNLISFADTPAYREAYSAVLPEVSAFFARLPTDERLWRAIREVADGDTSGLSPVQQRHLDKTLREFRRAGAELDPDGKARVEAIKIELTQLGTRFGQNVLDSTNAFELLLTGDDLVGLPENARRQAHASAEAKGLDGYRFTLQAPSYLPFMKSSERRELRETMYRAFVDRAATGEHDNRPLVRLILSLRRELAQLLGYEDFAAFVLETRMAGSAERALAFERELFVATEPSFRSEVAELERYARTTLGIERLEPWDIAFASERLRRERYDVDDEALRPYFPLDRVLDGMFQIAHRLFGVTVRERRDAPVWHPDVTVYDVVDEDGTLMGIFYADWFPREDKRAGAWMIPMVSGEPTDVGFEPHLAGVMANITPPEPDAPALLTHREVQTLFHEFGHLLHHALSRVEVPARSGTAVAWDFVELPSQIMENWTWEREALDLFARHVSTGDPIPDKLFHRMIAARDFHQGMVQMRQISLGSVDLALHIDYDPSADEDPIPFGNRVAEAYAIRPGFAQNNYLAAFAHVFAGGYAAGYYSYKWSEMLDADAFTRFRREGIFNPETGRAFVAAVLSRGDGAEASELFEEFMGRPPRIDALLERALGGAPVARGER